MTDTLLASSLKTVDPAALDFSAVEVDRAATLSPSETEMLDGYRRFELTESGISPRALPGSAHAVYSVPSDEHDEQGHITEDEPNRVAMMQKRMRKLDVAMENARGPELIGPAGADVTLACWGSTVGACLEAARLLNAAGTAASVLKFGDLWPLPSERVMGHLVAARKVIAVEQNYTGQLAKLLRMTTGFDCHDSICHYDGRPLTGEEITELVLEKVGTYAAA